MILTVSLAYIVVSSTPVTEKDSIPDTDRNNIGTITTDNSSGDEVTGDTYLLYLPVYYPNGTQINITEKNTCVDPKYGSLISFLKDDQTEHGIYDDEHECADFAVPLHDNAVGRGIKSHLVLVKFENGGYDHLIVAFNTTDRGIIYVDDTGLSEDQIARNLNRMDRLVDLEVGMEYKTRFIPPYDTMEDQLTYGVVKEIIFIS